MTSEHNRPLVSGDKVEVEGEDFEVTKTAASIFNFWEETGKPLPYVSVPMIKNSGEEVKIHVAKIDFALLMKELQKNESNDSEGVK